MVHIVCKGTLYHVHLSQAESSSYAISFSLAVKLPTLMAYITKFVTSMVHVAPANGVVWDSPFWENYLYVLSNGV